MNNSVQAADKLWDIGSKSKAQISLPVSQVSVTCMWTIRWQWYSIPGWEWWSSLWVGGPTRTPTRGCCTSRRTWSSTSLCHSFGLFRVCIFLICLFFAARSALLRAHLSFYFLPLSICSLCKCTNPSFLTLIFPFITLQQSSLYLIPPLLLSLSLSVGQVHILYFMHTITVLDASQIHL